jgi:hypothetical protein
MLIDKVQLSGMVRLQVAVIAVIVQVIIRVILSSYIYLPNKVLLIPMLRTLSFLDC